VNTEYDLVDQWRQTSPDSNYEAWKSRQAEARAVVEAFLKKNTPGVFPLVKREDVAAQILERTPQKRWGDPADVAGVVVFLCSDAARFITGTILPIDGGYAAT